MDIRAGIEGAGAQSDMLQQPGNSGAGHRELLDPSAVGSALGATETRGKHLLDVHVGILLLQSSMRGQTNHSMRGGVPRQPKVAEPAGLFDDISRPCRAEADLPTHQGPIQDHTPHPAVRWLGKVS